MKRAPGVPLSREEHMSQHFYVHPDNPQVRLIGQAVQILQNGGVIVYPTDSGYALGCQMGNKDALERILPFVAQSQGYLTGWVLTDRQAAVELANLRYMLDETRRALDGTPGLRFATFAAFRKSLATLRRTLRLTGLGVALDGLHKLADVAIRRSPAGLRRWGARWRLRAAGSDGAAR